MIINYLKCPKENGGCGRQNKFKIALDREGERVIINCKCGYRFSLPIKIDKIKKFCGDYLDETGNKIFV